MPTGQRKSGYALIELLVVLAIVGVLALAGAYYRMDRVGPAVKGASASLASTLIDARSLARAAGQDVSLVPSGSGSTLVLTYQNAGGLQGRYAHAADPAAARYCLLDADGTSEPTSSALLSLKGALEDTKAGGTDLFSADLWDTNLLASGSGVIFASNGTVNKQAYVALVGTTNGSPNPNGPVGILLVNGSGNLYRYYRSNPAAKWVRF